jgi:tetratricopeptide (TPR) repeat protein
MFKLQSALTGTLPLLVILAAGFLLASLTAGATGERALRTTLQVYPDLKAGCPARGDLETALGQASSLMQQSRFRDTVALLQPLSSKDCDARLGLLLAAAFDESGEERQAIRVLQHAHSVWPSNNSVSASLARKLLATGEREQAAKALAQFHGTAETPEQEFEMAVVVYLSVNQLVPAQTVAEVDYKYHPSIRSLLLLANTLQLQGRYPDVNRLLGSRRESYNASPEFLVTLAESEFDASIFPAARNDLERAVSLNPNLYQAHYLLGNVLAKLNDPDGAQAEYNRAIDLAPQQPRNYYQLALLLRSKRDDLGERKALARALAADDHYAPAHYELGRILLDDDQHPADAISHLLAAIQYNPRAEEAYFLLARAYNKLGEKDKADEIVKRLQTVRKENRPITP